VDDRGVDDAGAEVIDADALADQVRRLPLDRVADRCLGRRVNRHVGKALLVGDRSERDEDDIGFDSFVDRDRVDARIEFGGEFAKGFGAARIGDEDGNGLRGKEAGKRRRPPVPCL
jgi:hypothetical protein